MTTALPYLSHGRLSEAATVIEPRIVGTGMQHHAVDTHV